MPLLILLAVLIAAPAAAQQCVGDGDFNRRVDIAELITAVGNSLDGCPTPGPQPERCPHGLDSNAAFDATCVWYGRYNPDCGTNVHVSLDGRSSLLLPGWTMYVGPDGTFADMNRSFIHEEIPVSGEAYIDEATGDLVITTARPLAEIHSGCPVTEFRGRFLSVTPR